MGAALRRHGCSASRVLLGAWRGAATGAKAARAASGLRATREATQVSLMPLPGGDIDGRAAVRLLVSYSTLAARGRAFFSPP